MQGEMEGTRPSYGVLYWVGSHDTTRDISYEQAPALLIDKTYDYLTQDETQHQLDLENMKQWQCMIMHICKHDGEPWQGPLVYALLLNDLSTVSDWIVTGEPNKEGIFHCHAMLKTGTRTDSIRRTITSTWQALMCNEAFVRRCGPQSTFDCLKIQRCHKPSSMLMYLMKAPFWVASNNERLLKTAISLDHHNMNERFRPVPEPEQIAPIEEGINQMTKEIIEAVVESGAKTLEELMAAHPQMISKYLHRPGLPTIVSNCMAFVKATGGSWNICNFAKYNPDPGYIHKVLLHQEIQPSEFDEVFFKWITKQDSKRNTLYIKGPSNTGKSAFITGLKSIVPWGEIVNSNSFAFEGLLNCVIGVWEEPLCSPELAEKAKQVLEGMQCSIPVKYKKPQMLPRTPIIITTNHDLWRFCTREEDMFKNRMFMYEFKYPVRDCNFDCRACERSCQCSYCRASCGSAPGDGSSSPGRVQTGDQSIPPRKRGDFRTEPQPDVGSGSLRDPGEGPSWRYDSTCGSSSTSTKKQCTDSSGRASSSSTTIKRDVVGDAKHGSSSTRDGICSSISSPIQHVESRQSPRRDGQDSGGDGNTTSGKHKRKRDNGRDGGDIRQYGNIFKLGLGETSEKETSTISFLAKERRLDRQMGPWIDPKTMHMLPMQVPLKHDWQCYLSYLYHKYG
uniref:Nonstructural protein 1 n=1 Tax=Dendrocopos leucotos Chaphamaparvovirus TaxID=2794487 RepID=A0A8A4XDN1_9VIRU|nr:MAG: nonstructural protein 1 [Dendrocopos leucotos Chaphamaparvovirus]